MARPVKASVAAGFVAADQPRPPASPRLRVRPPARAARDWRLARAWALREFEKQTRGLPRATEAERLVRAAGRAGRVPRSTHGLLGRPLRVTGCAEPLLLRASHIKPWARCATDAERLDVKNGLLLAAHLDAAFDCGLIDFDAAGQIRFADGFARPTVSPQASTKS